VVSPEWCSAPPQLPREGRFASQVVIDLCTRPFPWNWRTRGGRQYENLAITTGGIVIFRFDSSPHWVVTGIAIVWTIGVIVLVVGLVLWLLGSLATQLRSKPLLLDQHLPFPSNGVRRHLSVLCLARFDECMQPAWLHQ